VTAARALAVRNHVLDRSTPGRLAGVKAAEIGGEDDLDALAEAHATLLDLVLAQQIQDLAQGLPPTPAVSLRNLTKRERERMRLALQVVAPIEQLTRDLLFEC
jgi:DNA polymerase-3 subunit epsilon/CBS domain-containing protein